MTPEEKKAYHKAYNAEYRKQNKEKCQSLVKAWNASHKKRKNQLNRAQYLRTKAMLPRLPKA